MDREDENTDNHCASLSVAGQGSLVIASTPTTVAFGGRTLPVVPVQPQAARSAGVATEEKDSARSVGKKRKASEQCDVVTAVASGKRMRMPQEADDNDTADEDGYDDEDGNNATDAAQLKAALLSASDAGHTGKVAEFAEFTGKHDALLQRIAGSRKVNQKGRGHIPRLY